MELRDIVEFVHTRELCSYGQHQQLRNVTTGVQQHPKSLICLGRSECHSSRRPNPGGTQSMVRKPKPKSQTSALSGQQLVQSYKLRNSNGIHHLVCLTFREMSYRSCDPPPAALSFENHAKGTRRDHPLCLKRLHGTERGSLNCEHVRLTLTLISTTRQKFKVKDASAM